MDDITLEEGLDFLASVGMDVKVVDEDGIKDHIILEPVCLQCEQKISKPSDCDMELFRYGIPLHLGGCVTSWAQEHGYEDLSDGELV